MIVFITCYDAAHAARSHLRAEAAAQKEDILSSSGWGEPHLILVRKGQKITYSWVY